jgi:acyl-CoA synthetase (NDP forming)
MASPDVAVDALFRQTGVIRVDTLDELFDMAMLLDAQPLPAGRRIAIVTNAGGPGILATDACAGLGLEIPTLSEATQHALRAFVDPNAAIANPIDLVASATPATYRQTLELVAADEGIDSVLAICTQTFAAPPAEVAEVLIELSQHVDKPIIGCFVAWPEMPPLLPAPAGGQRPVPAFASPEPAARALARAAGYSEWRQRPPGAVPDLADFDRDRIRAFMETHLATRPDGGWLAPAEVDEVLALAGIPHLRSATVADAAEAAQAATALGFPVALKAAGPEIVHKSDIGGVLLDVETAADVEAAFVDMQTRIGPKMTGAVVQQMATPGVETIVGVVLDPLFGPLVMFGLGGVATELLGDRSFRILPITDSDAADLVRSLKASPLLFGYRGAPAAAVGRLEDVIQRVGRLAAIAPELAELDLNPVLVSPDDAVAVDARVRLAPPPVVPI